jgi:hypothetical protein
LALRNNNATKARQMALKSESFPDESFKDKFRSRYGTTTYTVKKHTYIVKKVSNFPIPSLDVTKQTLPGGE